jgi:anaerobic magnesium-protoporphyrin IX monomethyl ester cyclase
MRFKKAIIINPPNPPGFVSNKDSHGGYGELYPESAPPFPPLDLAYLATTLAHAGFPVEVIEAGALRLDRAALRERYAAQAERAETLVLVRTSLPTIDWDLEVCGDLEGIGHPGALILFGPAVASLQQRIERESQIDGAILTEADGPAADLMKGLPPSLITGLMYREDGGWKRTADRNFEADLDSLPFPRWDLLPYERYVIPKSSASGHARFLPMLSSRGCPFGCSYCPYPVGQGLKWRYRTPVNVVDEMEQLVQKFGVQHIIFRDPMFSAQKKRVVAICEEIERRGLKVQWKCETRVDCLDERTIAAMGRAGCVGVNFGVESIDPEIQKGVHRQPISPQEFISIIAACRRHGISTFAFFILGLPGDTLQTIMESIEFAVQIRPSWTQFTAATPLIGTPLHSWAVSEGLVSPDFYRIVTAHAGSVGNENLAPHDVQRLHRFARFLQMHLINRHGILKNERSRAPLYRALKRLADTTSHFAAALLVKAARRWFASMHHNAARPKPRLERSGRLIAINKVR